MRKTDFFRSLFFFSLISLISLITRSFYLLSVFEFFVYNRDDNYQAKPKITHSRSLQGLRISLDFCLLFLLSVSRRIRFSGDFRKGMADPACLVFSAYEFGLDADKACCT